MTGDKLDGVVFNDPLGGFAGLFPVDGYGGEGGVGLHQVVDTGAGRDDVECDVVDVGVPGAGGAVGADGDIGAVAGIGVERHLELLPVGVVAHVDGVDIGEGGDVVRIGEDADVEERIVRGGA